MEQQRNSYRRLARPDEVPRLAMYVEEMDVLPTHGRRGLGARLLGRVCTWAEAQGHAAVTLSTFRDVPWNGPFYRKHGFRDLEPAEWTPGMRAIREKEAQHGLHVEARVFMRRELGGAAPFMRRWEDKRMEEP